MLNLISITNFKLFCFSEVCLSNIPFCEVNPIDFLIHHQRAPKLLNNTVCSFTSKTLLLDLK